MFQDEQIEALEKFQNLLSKIEWREKNGCYTSTKKPFQKGLLCSIKSTIELFHEMKEEGVKYILTKIVTTTAIQMRTFHIPMKLMI